MQLPDLGLERRSGSCQAADSGMHDCLSSQPTVTRVNVAVSWGPPTRNDSSISHWRLSLIAITAPGSIVQLSNALFAELHNELGFKENLVAAVSVRHARPQHTGSCAEGGRVYELC